MDNSNPLDTPRLPRGWRVLGSSSVVRTNIAKTPVAQDCTQAVLERRGSQIYVNDANVSEQKQRQATAAAIRDSDQQTA